MCVFLTSKGITTPSGDSLIVIVATGDTPIDYSMDDLTFTNIDAEYIFYIEGIAEIDLGSGLTIDTIDKLIGAKDPSGIAVSNGAFSDFNTLFDLTFEDSGTTFTMEITNMSFSNGVQVVAIDIDDSITSDDLTLTLSNVSFSDFNLTEHIFDIDTGGGSAVFTMESVSFSNILSEHSNDSYFISIEGANAISISDVTVTGSTRIP